MQAGRHVRNPRRAHSEHTPWRVVDGLRGFLTGTAARHNIILGLRNERADCVAGNCPNADLWKTLWCRLEDQGGLQVGHVHIHCVSHTPRGFGTHSRWVTGGPSRDGGEVDGPLGRSGGLRRQASGQAGNQRHAEARPEERRATVRARFGTLCQLQTHTEKGMKLSSGMRDVVARENTLSNDASWLMRPSDRVPTLGADLQARNRLIQDKWDAELREAENSRFFLLRNASEPSLIS